MQNKDPAAFFWTVAEPELGRTAVTKGTMMGFPCLRVNGAFYASADRHSGDLIVKLPAARVEELIDAGAGGPFAPNGRRFREWVVVTERDQTQWAALLVEARTFGGGSE